MAPVGKKLKSCEWIETWQKCIERILKGQNKHSPTKECK